MSAIQIRAARAPHPPLRGTFAPQAGRRTLAVGFSSAPRPAKRGEGGPERSEGPGEGSCILLKSFAVIRGSNLDRSDSKFGGPMKLIVAVIRPDRLSNVLEELFRAKVAGLTISRVQGHGGETERVETYRGTTVKMELTDKVRLEIGVSDHFVQPTIDAIVAGARTGDVGDGKIFVMPVDDIVRIRTGETDRAAVTPVGVPPD